mmetsp:Transcript_57156/g.180906  ORF Transcript_57156/g.180906 Transcript_57156/m.180906 type:complete len:132 (-) Transcript_57156:278-673(-)
MGGQSNSGKARVKRPDGRPNAAKRKKEMVEDVLKENKAMSFQEAKAIKKAKKAEAEENEARGDALQKMEMQAKLPYTTEKRIKALQKKLRHIDELKASTPKADMDAQQKEKVKKRAEIAAEIKALESGEKD